jgi:hypothetical protein
MNTQIFEQFADNYNSSTGFEKIRFDWNGEYGDAFHDKNYDFRVELCEFLIPKLETVKLELIRDLYLEMGKSSEATFGVYNNFHMLAQQLLQRGGTEYLMDYLEGASHTMDTGLSSGRISLTKERALQLLEYFDEKRRYATDQKEQRLLNDYMRQRLQYHANK